MALGVGIVIGNFMYVAAQESYSIPSWVKNTAKWWGEGQITDGDFIKALQYLIENKILVVPGNMSSTSQNTSPVQQNNAESSQTQITNESTNDLLPTRGDVGTEWVMKDPVLKNGNGTDYNNQISQIFTKSTSGINTIVTVTIDSFNSFNAAQQHYNSKITTLKSKGGYQEVSGLDSNCYGTMIDLTLTEKITVYCVKDNFYIVSSGLSGALDLQDYVIKFVKAVLGKT